MRRFVFCFMGLVAGCDDGGGGSPGVGDAAGAHDAGVPDVRVLDQGLDRGPADAALDGALDAAHDAAVDAFVGDAGWLPLDPALLPPPPAPLSAGMDVRRLPVPLGIGTSGYGPTQADPYDTPFQEIYPGTQHIHMHPDVRTTVLEAGENNRLYLIRIDTIGVSARIRQDLVDRLTARYGPQVDRQLIIAATHTHAGPGRLIDKPLWRVIQDIFWPELYERILDTLEAAVVAAVEDLEPARLGHGAAMTTAVHSDRRCANPLEDDPDFPIIRIDRADGRLKGLLLFHTVHGTALGMDDYALSQDVTGAIEAKVAESFEDPVFVMFLNGAAADMSPSTPEYPRAPAAASWPGSFTQTELVGRAAAEAVAPVVPTIETHAEVVLHSRLARAPINRQVLGYAEGVFPYEFGAVYCGVSFDERCLGEAAYTAGELLRGCIPFPNEENTAPREAPLTVGQIGTLGFITTPGEFSVSLGRVAREAAEEALGLPVVVMGYAQEYTGYSLTETDWWQGGYEASGALWGPRQGDWLAHALTSLARSYANPRIPLVFSDQPAPPSRARAVFEPRPVDPSATPPGTLEEPAEEVGPGDLATWTFAGGDPWAGNPVVTLERRTEDGFEVVRVGAVPVTSDGYAVTLSLVPEPGYRQPADARTYRWTARLPAVRTFGGGPTLQGGQFRFVARGQAALEGGSVEPYELTSRVFRVAP